jgi:hypothetical protein
VAVVLTLVHKYKEGKQLYTKGDKYTNNTKTQSIRNRRQDIQNKKTNIRRTIKDISIKHKT